MPATQALHRASVLARGCVAEILHTHHALPLLRPCSPPLHPAFPLAFSSSAVPGSSPMRALSCRPPPAPRVSKAASRKDQQRFRPVSIERPQRHELRRRLDLSRLVFSRQGFQLVGSLEDLPEKDRLSPLMSAITALGSAFPRSCLKPRHQRRQAAIRLPAPFRPPARRGPPGRAATQRFAPPAAPACLPGRF
jgi:hypothetical protein